MDRFVHDGSRWPLVTLIASEDHGDFDIALLRASFDRAMERGGACILLTDLRALTEPPGGSMRTQLADWLRDSEATFERQVVAHAIVTRQAVRAAITAIQWQQAPVVPTECFTTLFEGLSFLANHGTQAGLSLEPVRAYAAQEGLAFADDPRETSNT